MLEKPLVRRSSATPPRGQGFPGDRKVPRLSLSALPLSLRPPRTRDGSFSDRLLETSRPASLKLDGFSLSLVGAGRAQLKTDVTLREGEKVVVGTSTVQDRGLVVVVSGRVLRLPAAARFARLMGAAGRRR